MRRAVCPGSFDPIHNGHLEVIARAAGLFDEVIVAVSTNYAKKYRFSLGDRIEMARETLASLKGIVVEPVGEGLLAEYCRQRGSPPSSRASGRPRTSTMNCPWPP